MSVQNGKRTQAVEIVPLRGNGFRLFAGDFRT